VNPLRPYAPNNDPRNYGIVQGSARLLERIWQPGSQYRRSGAAWGLRPHERARAVVGWLPSRAESLDSYKYTQPELAPERITSFDALHFVNTLDAGMGFLLGGSTAYEVARVDVQHGLLVLESIETWARLNPQRPGGPHPQADELLSWDPGDRTQQVPDLRAFGSPFPFPVPHDHAAGSPLSIEWVLVFDRRSQRGEPANLLGPAPLAQVPEAMGTPAYWPRAWRDMRYTWNRQPPNPQKWTATGPGVLRLFAKVLTEPLAGGTDPSWQIQIAGRLRGYQQPAGPSGAAFYNATLRH
jgi:hypothetical protein